jgi:ABC-type Zn uptake system ZnuABC Zn-binding protein ZnuA
LKIDIIYYYEKLIHSNLTNCIEETANSQVLFLNSIEGAHQEEKKGIGYIKRMDHNVAILKVEMDCK